MIQFSKQIEQVLNKIHQEGFEANIVGGALRDALLNIKSYDMDINTNCPLNRLVEIFKDNKPEIFTRFGNLRFKINAYTVAITTYRKELSYSNHRYPNKLDFNATLIDDLNRRDFTINAILYNHIDGITDPLKGQNDLKSQLIRCIGNPNERFNEDYLRMLRAFRFAAKLNFDIETHTLKALEANYSKISKLKQTQLEQEFLKFLNAPNFMDVVLKYPYVLSHIIEEYQATQSFDQNNKYHKYSLFEHSIRVVSEVEGLELKFAALFHDLGKLHTRTLKDNGNHGYPNHSEASLEIMKPYLESFQLEGMNKKNIEKLVRYHDMSIPEDYNTMKRLVYIYGYDFMRQLIALKRADNLAKSEHAAYQVVRCTLYDSFLDRIKDEKSETQIKDLNITGKDIDVIAKNRKKVLELLLFEVMDNTTDNNKEALQEAAKRINDELYTS